MGQDTSYVQSVNEQLVIGLKALQDVSSDLLADDVLTHFFGVLHVLGSLHRLSEEILSSFYGICKRALNFLSSLGTEQGMEKAKEDAGAASNSVDIKGIYGTVFPKILELFKVTIADIYGSEGAEGAWIVQVTSSSLSLFRVSLPMLGGAFAERRIARLGLRDKLLLRLAESRSAAQDHGKYSRVDRSIDRKSHTGNYLLTHDCC